MRYRVSALMLLLFIPLLLTSNPVSQTPAQSPEKPLYRPTGKEAMLLGTVTVIGTLPKPRIIDMAADPICTQLNKKRQTEYLITNDDRLQNAFVYVMGDHLKAYRFELPDSEVILQRVNCQYVPHVVGLRVGQKLQITNNDPTHHNTHPTPKLNVEWNQTQAPGSEPLVKTFLRQEALIPFKCNHHPWERSWVGVMDHPFFAVSSDLGNYEIGGLPPGTYKLVAWHEVLGEQEFELTLVAGEQRRVDFTFDVEKSPKKSLPYWPMGSVRRPAEPPAAGSSPGK